MKTFALVIKYVVVPCTTVVGIFYAFDGYVVNRANTAVEPTKVRVDAIGKNVEEITIRTRNIERILMESK
jgi:predicted ABC-type ATPase